MLAIIADDEPPVRAFVRDVLADCGFDALEVSGGIEAFEMVQELNGQLDLLVSDVRMPNGDGLMLARSMARAYPRVPVLLMSAFVGTEEEIRNPIVSKPFTPEALTDAVRTVLQRPDGESL